MVGHLYHPQHTDFVFGSRVFCIALINLSVSQLVRREELRPICSFSLRIQPGSDTHHFHRHPIGQNLISWLYLAAGEAGKWNLWLGNHLPI